MTKKAILIAAVTVAVHLDGKRLDIQAGKPLPDGLDADTLQQLRRLKACKEEIVEDGSAAQTAETKAELDRAAAEAVAGPGESVEDILAAASAETAKADEAGKAEAKPAAKKNTPAKAKT